MVNRAGGENIGGTGSSENPESNGQQRKASVAETTLGLSLSTNEVDEPNMENIIDIDNDEEIKNRFTHTRVLHNFRGCNNDELCMKKDDIITLTQTPSGGWWEGTLDGITGWFPANYVTPIMSNDPLYQQLVFQQGGNEWKNQHNHSGPDSMGDHHLAEYRSIVMKVIEDSETQFIQSLQDAINHYLMPIYQYKILPSETELNAVLRSITEICSVHRRFLTSIEKIKSVPYKDNRIGGLFMQYAPQFKHAHFEYCSHHAKFVHMIEKCKKEICAFFSSIHQPVPPSLTQSLASPSHSNVSPSTNLASMPNVQITSLLSVSFRRLDKYPALLQELQRYTEENHFDRGDIQRAGFVYREISMSCLELRRRKEMELEVMLGNIKNFDNLNIETYGQIIKMEPVSILMLPTWSETKRDCYLVLFPKILMILSVGKEMTSFTFESMMKLENAKLQPINLMMTNGQDQLFSLEISGQNAHPFSQKLTTSDQTEQLLQYIVRFTDEDVWREYYQLLQKQIRHQTIPPTTQSQQQSAELSPNSMSMLSSNSILQQQISGSGPNGAASSSSSNSSSAIFSPQSSSISVTSPDQPVPTNLPPKPPQYRIQHVTDGPPPPPPMHQHRPPPPAPMTIMNIEMLYRSLPKRATGYWSEQLLTPHTPYRPTDALSNQQNQSEVGQMNQESSPNDDMQLLNVIDAYHRKFPPSSSSLRGSGGVELGKTQHKLSNPLADQLDQSNYMELEPYQYVEILGVTKLNNRNSGLHRNLSARNARKNSLTMLVQKINKLSLSSMDRDILYEIYDQLRVIRNEMSHLSEKVHDERRQRKRLQHLLAKIHQQPTSNV